MADYVSKTTITNIIEEILLRLLEAFGGSHGTVDLANMTEVSQKDGQVYHQLLQDNIKAPTSTRTNDVDFREISIRSFKTGAC